MPLFQPHHNNDKNEEFNINRTKVSIILHVFLVFTILFEHRGLLDLGYFVMSRFNFSICIVIQVLRQIEWIREFESNCDLTE